MRKTPQLSQPNTVGSFFLYAALFLVLLTRSRTDALNGDPSKLSLEGIDGWKTFEVITQGDRNGDGYTVPGEIDGIGAFLWNGGNTLRVLANHETGRACDIDNESTVTEVDLNLSRFKRAIANMLDQSNLGGERSFVSRFRRAYDVIVDDNGREVTSLPRKLKLLCSSQAYGPNTFGVEGEGFQDQIYIAGEEQKGAPYGRLFAIDSSARKMYQVSGRTGDASRLQGGIGGMPWDSFENIALIRTFEKKHVAFLMGIDGGSEKLKLYVGQKNKGVNGEADSTDFLARNGLAYGSWYYLRGDLPLAEGEMKTGYFRSSDTDVLSSAHFEDVDTNPLNPTQVVLGEEKEGVFVLDFNLSFSGGQFQSDAGGSSYSIAMIVQDSTSPLNGADNVAWTEADLIYVATDGLNGAIWEMDSDGKDQVKVAQSKNSDTDYNPSGIVDISRFVGYEPASIFLASTMNCGSSMSVLINPNAVPQLTPAPSLSAAKCGAAKNKCSPVLGTPRLGEGEIIHHVKQNGKYCREICFYSGLSREMEMLGWSCGPCP